MTCPSSLGGTVHKDPHRASRCLLTINGGFSQPAEACHFWGRCANDDPPPPESGRARGLGPQTWCPSHPALPSEQVPEVSSSDDRRIFSFTDAGFQRVLHVNQMTCLTSSGAINNAKLKAYCPEAQPTNIKYSTATVNTSLGAIKAEAGGLEMVKVPIIMGGFHGRPSRSTGTR